MYGRANDLEFGIVAVSAKVKWLVDLYKKNEGKLRYIIFAVVGVTLALVIKFAFYNFDNVVGSSGVITFDESVYTPFKLSATMIPHTETKTSIQFPLKDNDANSKGQISNLVHARAHVVTYLESTGFCCIHLRHFGVPYDIIVFRNLTMINPLVLNESPTRGYVNEMALDGTTSRKQRPVWLEISFINVALVKQSVTLVGDQVKCFTHYEF